MAAMGPRILAGNPVTFQYAWVPSLGIGLDFYVDGLSYFFLLLITGIGALVTLYAAGYLDGDRDLGKFYLSLFAFMGSMIGVVSADHLLVLFVFWELTSLSSYLLISYHHEDAKSRGAALQALLVTVSGGLCLLAGIILLARISGTYLISELLKMDPTALMTQPGSTWILILVLLGAFTKSAQFPFHFWLPNAMAAPAPVSAYLHSATMVKAGVFLLARLFPVLSVSSLWLPIVAPVGAVTLLVGAVLACGQKDLKRILAYTTVGVLGMLTLLLGLGTELAVKAAMAVLLAHALYKAALFLCAGSVDHATGIRDPDQLGGLRAAMPRTATAALLAALSMAGVPLWFGFVSKESLYEALLAAPGNTMVLGVIGLLANALMVALALEVGWKPFWGSRRKKPAKAHEVLWMMWLGPCLLGVLGLLAGIFPAMAGVLVVAPAVEGVTAGKGPEVALKLWHGLTPVLALSGATFLLGWGFFQKLPDLRRAGRSLHGLTRWGPESLYEQTVQGVLVLARWQTAILQNGSLRNYLLTCLLFNVALVGWFLPWPVVLPPAESLVRPHVLSVTICLLMIAGAILACLANSRFTAILGLGVVGMGVAMVFFIYSAPDLALTQILVETLTLVLFVLAFCRLPLFKNYSSRGTKIRDALLASVFGAVMCMVVLAEMSSRSQDRAVSQFYGEQSLVAAKGHNVVNVILVDFRALDTLGEITVLVIAALGVSAMIRLRPANKTKGKA
jgi:multicomponent Na+:H+ antiporter subunit A